MRLLRCDLRRAFRMPTFYVPFAVCICIMAYLALQTLQLIPSYNEYLEFRKTVFFPLAIASPAYLSPYVLDNPIAQYYWLALPLLVLIPTSMSLLYERRSGYYQHLLMSFSLRDYLVSKLTTNAIVVTAFVAVPLLVNLALLMCIWPIQRDFPSSDIGSIITHTTYLSGLYYKNFILYYLSIILTTVISSVMWSTIVMGASFYLRRPIVVLLGAFLFHLSYSYLLGSIFYRKLFAPAGFQSPVLLDVSLYVALAHLLLYGVLSALLFLFMRKKHFESR